MSSVESVRANCVTWNFTHTSPSIGTFNFSRSFAIAPFSVRE